MYENPDSGQGQVLEMGNDLSGAVLRTVRKITPANY